MVLIRLFLERRIVGKHRLGIDIRLWVTVWVLMHDRITGIKER